MRLIYDQLLSTKDVILIAKKKWLHVARNGHLLTIILNLIIPNSHSFTNLFLDDTTSCFLNILFILEDSKLEEKKHGFSLIPLLFFLVFRYCLCILD